MKKLILFCCVLFGANAISQAQTTKCGVYQLINTKVSKNVLKDHNIVLEKGANGKISGRFYGTTDTFEDVREGYLPSHFVAPMENLRVTKDSIFFTINVAHKDLFKNPIPCNVKTAKAAHALKRAAWKSGWIGDNLQRSYAAAIGKGVVRY